MAPSPSLKDDHPDHTFKSKRMLRLQTLSACARRMKAARKSQMSQVAIRLYNMIIITGGYDIVQKLMHYNSCITRFFFIGGGGGGGVGNIV